MVLIWPTMTVTANDTTVSVAVSRPSLAALESLTTKVSWFSLGHATCTACAISPKATSSIASQSRGVPMRAEMCGPARKRDAKIKEGDNRLGLPGTATRLSCTTFGTRSQAAEPRRPQQACQGDWLMQVLVQEETTPLNDLLYLAAWQKKHADGRLVDRIQAQVRGRKLCK